MKRWFPQVSVAPPETGRLHWGPNDFSGVYLEEEVAPPETGRLHWGPPTGVQAPDAPMVAPPETGRLHWGPGLSAHAANSASSSLRPRPGGSIEAR